MYLHTARIEPRTRSSAPESIAATFNAAADKIRLFFYFAGQAIELAFALHAKHPFLNHTLSCCFSHPLFSLQPVKIPDSQILLHLLQAP
jgi:hypothetical protein